jgi:hypothetical protein
MDTRIRRTAGVQKPAPAAPRVSRPAAPRTPLEVARAVGNQAFIRILAREPAAPVADAAPAAAPALDTDALAVAIMTTGKAGKKIHSLADLRDLWASAEAAIRLEPRKGKLPATSWKQLRTPEVEAALTAMTS